jgi:hypothetical protein
MCMHLANCAAITSTRDDTLDTTVSHQGQAYNLTNDGLFEYTYDVLNP